MSPSEARGFSLVELLVTVVIVAVIAVFATPQFEKHRIRRANMQASADLKDLNVKIIQYHNENGVYPPSIGPLTGDVRLNPQQTPPITFTTARGVYIAVRSGTGRSTYTAAAKNTAGDTIYHVDSRSQVPTEKRGMKGVPLQVSDIGAPPAPTGIPADEAPAAGSVTIPDDEPEASAAPETSEPAAAPEVDNKSAPAPAPAETPDNDSADTAR